MTERAGAPWTLDEEKRLYEATARGMSASDIAIALGRTRGAITSRQRQMGLRDETGKLISPLPEFRSYLRAKDNRKIPSAATRSTKPNRASIVRHASTTAVSRSAESRPRTVQAVTWPQDFPWTGNVVEKLWHALCYDITVLNPKKHQPGAMAERWIDVAMARLTPGQEFYPGAKLAELADKYSVSRERIRQVEVNVLRRLSWGIKQKSSLTAAVLDLVKDEVPDEQADAPLAWFATELGSQGCSSNFTQFMLEAFLLRNGTPRKIARQLSKEAMAPIRKIGRAKISARGRSTEQDEISEGVLKANAFVLEILKKAVWPQHLNKQPVDLTGFQPLRACRYDRPYYSKTLQRLVGFDSMGERRLIKALDSCTIVTEFVEQPVDIRYHYDGADRIYIPDLLVRTDTDLFFIIEVKGRTRLTDRETLAKAAAAQSHLGARSIGYCLVDENGFGLDDLRALTPDDEFMQQLGSLLEQKGEVQRWMFERAFERERLAWAYDQLQSAVLREGLLYETWLIERRDMPNRYIFDFRLRLS